MLARPGRALPAELYAEIFAYLDLCDLAQLSRTCRILFDVTIVHIWRVVRLRPLLALLPGVCIPIDSGVRSEQAALKLGMASKDYYARFSFYAPYVEVLKTESWSYLCSPSRYIAGRLMYGPLDRIELPSLKEIDMGYTWSGWGGRGLGHVYNEPSLMWMTLLIPPTLKSLSFTATDQRDVSLLGTLLARCPQLTRFKFRPDQQPNWDTWLSVSAFRIPQEITSLEVYCAEINNAGYSWISKLPKLQYLELLLCQRFSQSTQRGLHSASSNTSPAAYPHAFSALRSLCISVTDKDRLQQIIHIWRTIAAHITHATINALEQAVWTLDMFDKLFVGLASHCSKVFYLDFHESKLLNNGADMLPLPVSQLSALEPLPLRILKINRPLVVSGSDDRDVLTYIATLFPDLEELDLEETSITIEDLLQATVHFPHIRRLEIGLHTLKPKPELLSVTLRGYVHADSNYTSKATLILELCIDDHRGDRWAYVSEDWDFIAGSLASRWSSVSIKTSPIGELLERTYEVNSKFAFHSAQRARNRRRSRERESML